MVPVGQTDAALVKLEEGRVESTHERLTSLRSVFGRQHHDGVSKLLQQAPRNQAQFEIGRGTLYGSLNGKLFERRIHGGITE